jgi:predicted PurR-regulated permease PerM
VAPEIKISRQNIFVIAFFVLLIALLSLLFSLLEPFLRSFVWAAILAMVFHPLYSRMLRATGDHPWMAALISTLLVVAFLALPGFFIVLNLGPELHNAYDFLSTAQWDQKSQWLVDKLKALNIGAWLQSWGIDSNQYEAAIQRQISNAMENFSHMALEKISEAFQNVVWFVLEVLFICVALFFFFRDGSRLAFRATELLPLDKKYQEKVAHTFSVTVTAVVRAIFLTALAQGFMTGLGLVATGVPVPILLGVAAFILSFIPFLGAASVWIPSVIWLFSQDQVGAGVGLTLWGLVITSMDYIIKPWVIGNEAKLPLFWLFFTTIGGLKVYGLLGVFLGPIILSMGIAFLAIYREVYLNLQKPAPEPRKRVR